MPSQSKLPPPASNGARKGGHSGSGGTIALRTITPPRREDRTAFAEFWTNLPMKEKVRLLSVDSPHLLNKLQEACRTCTCSVCGAATNEETERQFNLYLEEVSHNAHGCKKCLALTCAVSHDATPEVCAGDFGRTGIFLSEKRLCVTEHWLHQYHGVAAMQALEKISNMRCIVRRGGHYDDDPEDERSEQLRYWDESKKLFLVHVAKLMTHSAWMAFKENLALDMQRRLLEAEDHEQRHQEKERLRKVKQQQLKEEKRRNNVKQQPAVVVVPEVVVVPVKAMAPSQVTVSDDDSDSDREGREEEARRRKKEKKKEKKKLRAAETKKEELAPPARPEFRVGPLTATTLWGAITAPPPPDTASNYTAIFSAPPHCETWSRGELECSRGCSEDHTHRGDLWFREHSSSRLCGLMGGCWLLGCVEHHHE